jgi:hypothetical protein
VNIGGEKYRNLDLGNRNVLDQDLGAIRGFMFEDHISSVDGNFCERLSIFGCALSRG